MERWQAQENLSQLVNIESLVGRLTKRSEPEKARNERGADVVAALEVVSSPSPAVRGEELRDWPRHVLSSSLSSRIQPLAPSRTATGFLDSRRLAITPLTIAPTLPSSGVDGMLGELLDLLTADVLAARDRLLMLNPGRRKMIEHRLEFIARKVARARGERLNRSLSLPDVLKESYRDALPGQPLNPAPKLSIAAWRGFVAEVALYNLLQLFFLKSLDVYGWRPFESGDLGRMNFAAHTFLSSRAAGFAHDKHCWNFVRTNLYSWYVPSPRAQAQLTLLLEKLSTTQFSWSDRDLESWATGLATSSRVSHMDFAEESRIARLVVELFERHLGMPLTVNFQGRPVCRKFFVPALELGGVALAILDKLLGTIRQAAPNAYDGGVADESSQLHRAVWACESESFEAFWTEVLTLLKVLRTARSSGDYAGDGFGTQDTSAAAACLYRLPHAAHVVNALGLELHNLEQLPLGGPEVSKMHQGSAAQIQQLEAFDAAIVTDHPDRVKSAAWMKALAQQLPYWRSIVGTGTNLNWGELHLSLAMSKLKEDGLCLYLSHRQLPEGGDGERLRRSLLSLGTLEYYIELGNEDGEAGPGFYRYLYVFRRNSKKLDRDQHRPRFGQLKGGAIDLTSFEESSTSQAEISERGWDHLFVRGAAPLVRHLNNKFPKLFQIASLGSSTQPGSLFSGADMKALEFSSDASGGLRFGLSAPAPSDRARDALLIHPHNPVDVSWIQCLLNSAPAQFWIRHQLLASAAPGKAPRYQDLRSCPIVDLSHAPIDLVHEALEWMSSTRPDAAELRAWALKPDTTLTDRYAKYVAAAKRHAELERIVARYLPLFTSPAFEELRHDAVNRFYPASLLCHLSQSPDLRIQCVDRTRSSLLPENWTVDEVHSVVRDSGGAKPAAYIVVQMRQGPSIQMLAPLPIREYLTAQLKALRAHTWGETLSLLRVPRDVPAFAAQTAEITRVAAETARDLAVYQRVLEEMALELFEISSDVRQFLPH